VFECDQLLLLDGVLQCTDEPGVRHVNEKDVWWRHRQRLGSSVRGYDDLIEALKVSMEEELNELR
jgi:hypothetical protein